MNATFPPPLPNDFALPPAGGGSGIGRIIAWAVIVVSVMVIGGENFKHTADVASPAAPPARVAMTFELIVRFDVGYANLLKQAGKSLPDAKTMLEQLDGVATNDLDKLAVAAVAAELQGKQAALARLYNFSHPPGGSGPSAPARSATAPTASAPSDPGPEASAPGGPAASAPPTSMPQAAAPTGSTANVSAPDVSAPETAVPIVPGPGVSVPAASMPSANAPSAAASGPSATVGTTADRTLDQIVQALRTVYGAGPNELSSQQRALLTERLDWCGKLALCFEQPEGDPARAAVLQSAQQTVITIAVGGVIVVGALVVGLILMVLLIVRLSDNTLILGYQPAPAGADAFLEAFAIYIGGMTVGSLAVNALPVTIQKHLMIHVAAMILPTILAIFWPLIRGVDRWAWQSGLGWHGGRGALREIGAGIVGYLAGLPLLAVGFVITAILISHAKAHPTHPIEEMIGRGMFPTIFVYLLASVYAPITEETLFRGAFFHALRSRQGWVLAAAVTSFVFAAIHPQGWTTIPVLMSIAIVLAAIREWRGTILSSATAHCLHNTTLVTFAILAMR